MTENTEVQSPPKQVGVLVVTHGSFGAALLEAAQMILGPQLGVDSVSVLVSKGVDEIVVALKAGVANLDSGMGVMVLTDLFGGTPTTLSLSLLKGGNLEVVSGVNLPMLLKVLQGRQMKLPELASQAKAAGQDGIKVPGEMLRKKPAGS
ncbi:MAG: PTS sugar transporter subunit IIA [Humidesulfovibrio sp.]|uniref:PTS sugar transporter subunit IIA n=1 Tax=Humidesulfovibrio sp. TaxID=2910988 RepID=UPI0027EB7F57|nr:PTS sugar transporter subunit IIA [Humidesulfovibrio sp.]MDQ7834508.1 PTS sugar transporter subunit IIA [Humidesulfovibrio sp.]